MTLIKAILQLVCTGLFAVSGAVAQSPAEDRVSEQLRQRMEQLMKTGSLLVQSANIGVADPLPEFYTRRDFRRVWTRAERVEELLRLVATSGDHGLNPEDYFLSKLRDQVENARRNESRPVTGQALDGTGSEDREIPPDDASRAAELDILLTEALIRYGYHRRFGKVTPTTVEPNWNFKRAFAPGVSPVGLLEEAVHAESLVAFVEERIAHGPWYKRLQTALKRYRSIAASGGWAMVPTGPALKPGGADPRVSVLRERLGITGDLLARGAGSSDLYDVELERAVRRFQDRHAVSVDGVVGRQTLAALNVPLQARIDQLRLSLERARWVFESVVPRYVAVNIAGFRAAMIREGNFVWTARVVVGRAYRQTPVFRGEVQYLVLNPTWTVPPGILRNDTLPKVKKDPAYLRRENIRVIDRDGRSVDPSSVNWWAYGGSVPYTLRQDAGADNALGRIKFVFPNAHSVYLHDTPARNTVSACQQFKALE
jgi:L,D-transpeptidase YcbB